MSVLSSSRTPNRIFTARISTLGNMASGLGLVPSCIIYVQLVNENVMAMQKLGRAGSRHVRAVRGSQKN
jgi:hypothetical protein